MEGVEAHHFAGYFRINAEISIHDVKSESRMTKLGMSRYYTLHALEI